MSQTMWERRECVSAEVEDSLVLLDLDTLKYHSLNCTAAAVWQLLEQPQDTGRIVDGLVQRYHIEPEPCRVSVQRLLGELQQSGLVKQGSPPPELARAD